MQRACLTVAGTSAGEATTVARRAASVIVGRVSSIRALADAHVQVEKIGTVARCALVRRVSKTSGACIRALLAVFLIQIVILWALAMAEEVKKSETEMAGGAVVRVGGALAAEGITLLAYVEPLLIEVA